jgi:hypothetical protein
MNESSILYFVLAGVVWFVNGMIWYMVHPAILHGYEDAKKWNILHLILNTTWICLLLRGIYIAYKVGHENVL